MHIRNNLQSPILHLRMLRILVFTRPQKSPYTVFLFTSIIFSFNTDSTILMLFLMVFYKAFFSVLRTISLFKKKEKQIRKNP